jgi:hypothetical protein
MMTPKEIAKLIIESKGQHDLAPLTRELIRVMNSVPLEELDDNIRPSAGTPTLNKYLEDLKLSIRNAVDKVTAAIESWAGIEHFGPEWGPSPLAEIQGGDIVEAAVKTAEAIIYYFADDD